MSTTVAEELVAQVRQAWADVLGVGSAEDVPVDVNFLETGGNSMLLVMLWEELQPLGTRPLKLSELFQHGTVLAQTELLAGKAAEEAPAEEPGRRSLLGARRAAVASAGSADTV